MKKVIALVFLLAGLAAGYHGYQLYEDANAGFSVLGLDISASDQEVTRQAYMYFGLAALGVVAAFLVWRRA